MNELDSALAYASQGWPVFPCNPQPGELHKKPLTKNGFNNASTDYEQIKEWWRRHPTALIGVPTGEAIGAVVFDIDVKHPDENGYDTLDILGVGILPETPMAITGSSGLHLYFAIPSGGLRNTAGKHGKGIGPGLDWRGTGGYVIVPPSAGYSWEPHWNFQTVGLAEVPPALLPRKPERTAPAKPVQPETGLSPYYAKALDSACRHITSAPCGEQEATLNGECFAIGTLAGAGAIPSEFARRALLWAAAQMPSYDPRRPWTSSEITNKVARLQ